MQFIKLSALPDHPGKLDKTIGQSDMGNSKTVTELYVKT